MEIKEINQVKKSISKKEIDKIIQIVQNNGFMLASGNVKYDNGFTIIDLCSTSLNQGRNVYLFINGLNKYIVNTAYTGYDEGNKYYVKDIFKVSEENLNTLKLLANHGLGQMFNQ
tara:strand:- start:523 stop:867 length:345 start_codon:yes stop_codon:yes gene_type:complete